MKSTVIHSHLPHLPHPLLPLSPFSQYSLFLSLLLVDLYLSILPIYSSSSSTTKRESVLETRKNRPCTFAAQTHSRTLVPALGPQVSERISEMFVQFQSLSSGITEEYLYLLIAAVIEGLTHKCRPKNNSQLISCIQTLTNIGSLLEDLLDLWFHVRSATPSQFNGNIPSVKQEQSMEFLCTNLLYRLILRVWLTLFQNTLTSLTSPALNDELQYLLSRPITMVTSDSLSLNRDWLFIGQRSLDVEFSFTFLESLFASISVTNFYTSSSHVMAEHFLNATQTVFSSECQDLLVYLCSKLQSLPRQSSIFESILSSIHLLLCLLTREMISLSDHIHRWQNAGKSQLLQQQDHASESTNYSLERSLEFDKLEQRLCKISQSLLTIFDNVPNIQLLSLQLLAQTGLDKVGIINDFLPRVSHSSVWSMPEVLDLYLELLEKAWFQLSSEYTGSTDFWSKVSHYATPLIQGSKNTVTQVIYHLQFLLTHDSCHLKSSLTKHVILKYHSKILEDFQNKVYCDPDWVRYITNQDIFEMEEEKVYHQYLKLLQKMAAHPSSLVPFLQNPQHLFLLFLFVPVSKFRSNALEVFKVVLTTLSTPWEASVMFANKLPDSKVHHHLINSLSRIAFEFNAAQVTKLCYQLSSTGMSVGCLDIRHVDRVHKTIQDFLEHSAIPNLLSPAVVYDLQLVTDVWEVLAVTTETCTSLLHILDDNQIWDVIHVLSLSSANLLSRLQSSSDDNTTLSEHEVNPLKQTLVALLCHVLAMAMSMSRLKEDSMKVNSISLCLCKQQ